MADDPEAAQLDTPSQERQDAQVAAAATAREIPQGGGTSAALAGTAAGHSPGPQSHALRIVANPSLPGPSPLLVRPDQVGCHAPAPSHHDVTSEPTACGDRYAYLADAFGRQQASPVCQNSLGAFCCTFFHGLLECCQGVRCLGNTLTSKEEPSGPQHILPATATLAGTRCRSQSKSSKKLLLAVGLQSFRIACIGWQRSS